MVSIDQTSVCMKKHLVPLIVFIFLLAVTNITAQLPVSPIGYADKLWYTQPAINWNEALPIGNGRMGAMVSGGIMDERLSLNEQTLWSGAPRNWNNPGAKAYLPQVREAIWHKNYRDADSLSRFMQGPYTESYLPMADLAVSCTTITHPENYTRELDLNSALSNVQFSENGNTHTRTSFVSFPDQVIVYHDTCTAKSSVTFTVTLSSKLHYKLKTLAPNHIVLTGKCPQHVEPVYRWWIKDDKAIQYAAGENGEGMRFEIHLLVKANGGKTSCHDNTIKVENAHAATLLITAATSYNGYDKSPGLNGRDPSLKASTDLWAASSKTYKQLLQRHLQDYQPIFRRVQLNLGESRNSRLPTDERLKNMDVYTDPELLATISQYGRYLLIAGSRPGGLPVNLKGIWNDKVRPEYSSNWCLDHDAQMFYYPAETNHLPEMHQPFLQFIEDLSVNGRQTALTNYGMKGWCAHHNTDIWRQTAPVGNYGDGNPHWANWNMAGPWLCAHLFEHYLFTGDEKYLRQKAWPVMKGAAEFCLAWLVKDSNGNLVTAPSVSPENTFITSDGDTAQVSSNSTADIALIKELFTNCIRTAGILQTAPLFAARLKKALAMFRPYGIGSKGQLLEWQEDWQAVDPGHRHLSHLYPVFPGSEISTLHTPALATAAKKALSLREKTNGTWGFALKAACWARLREGDSAWETLHYQLRYVAAESKSSANNYGLYPNLFNSEVPATIMNGNGCTTAVITEMLLQSHTGELQFLPALPTALPAGSIKGLCARGGFTVDLQWKNHELVSATILSVLGNDCSILLDRRLKIYDGSREVALMQTGQQVFVFKTTKGKTYWVRPM